ncbi:hypothetical protein CCP3SC1_210031 [Gammaproteobacteria bacterium]
MGKFIDLLVTLIILASTAGCFCTEEADVAVASNYGILTKGKFYTPYHH